VSVGGLALGSIVGVVAVAFAALLATAIGDASPGAVLTDPYVWRIVRFTVWQALLSMLLSVGLAVPVARALARRPSFAGRNLLLGLFALPLALPALVAVLGVVEVWGRMGWVSSVMRTAGLDGDMSIYGLTGILLAHVFFNLPLGVRMLLVHLERVPAENWRLASQLGMPALAVWRFIEWPALRAALPGVASLVFMLCVTSFTVVLTLGGGPKATTMEVAIYQALRFDFDPVRAVILSLLQIGLCGLLVWSAGRLTMEMGSISSLGRQAGRPGPGSTTGRMLDAIVIGAAGVFVSGPVVAVVVAGLLSDLPRLIADATVWRAVATSTGVAMLASALCLGLALALLGASRRLRWGRFSRASDLAASLILVMPPVVLGAGWFVLLRDIGDIFTLAPAVVVVANAMMALPFVMKVMAPAVRQADNDHRLLCASLGLAGWHRLRLIDWPVLKRPLALSLAFAAALSIGDLGVIALFGSEDFVTLPYLLYQRFGTYRIDDAAGLALILVVYCLGLIASASLVRGDGRKEGL
jgi:thiamine transport system permease protein